MSQTPPTHTIEAPFGTLPDGREVLIFTLTNRNGVTARVMEYGATLVSLEMPDRDGKVLDVTLGCDALEDWVANRHYFGATIGRYGNRIADGKFLLAGEEYSLPKNNDPGGVLCHLHGGNSGFDKKLWQGKVIEDGVELRYTSLDGEEGYPGEVAVVVRYILDDENRLTWEATATTSKATPINIVHHPYWNLSGDASSSTDDHLLTLHADRYLATGIGMIPTGVAVDVLATPMDFREESPAGARVNHDYPSLTYGNGYDHCYLVSGEGLRPAARLQDPKTGRSLTLETNQPGIHFYSGNFLEEGMTGKGGVRYGPRNGLCLESERLPDSPNQANFPSSILQPGEIYRHTVIHKFTW